MWHQAALQQWKRVNIGGKSSLSKKNNVFPIRSQKKALCLQQQAPQAMYHAYTEFRSTCAILLMDFQT